MCQDTPKTPLIYPLIPQMGRQCISYGNKPIINWIAYICIFSELLGLLKPHFAHMFRMLKFITWPKLMTLVTTDTLYEVTNFQNSIGCISWTKRPVDMKLGSMLRVPSSVRWPKQITSSGHVHFPLGNKFQHVRNETSDRLEIWQSCYGYHGLSRDLSWWRRQDTPTFYDPIYFKIQSPKSQEANILSTLNFA